MIFNKEADFEEALIKMLSEKGWEKNVFKKLFRRRFITKLGGYSF